VLIARLIEVDLVTHDNGLNGKHDLQDSG
jgi:hypothetical protein